MHGTPGDELPPHGYLMPPAVTQRNGVEPAAAPEARMAPPFVAGSDPAEVAASPAFAAPSAGEDESMPWETMSDEGVVEPMFEADTDAVLAELSQQAKKEEFPLDAFIIPDHAQRVPSGLEGKPLPPHAGPTPLNTLADRLEKLSHRLRVEDTEVMVRRLAGGDRLDALLAGLLAGYLAGSE